MKKILFILSSLKIGGLERVLVTTANRLAEKGYKVTVEIFNPIFDLKDELDESIEFIYKPPKPHLGNKIPYIRHIYYDYGLWETRTSARRLYDYYVGNKKYDVEIAFFRGRAVKIISGSRNPDSVKLTWVHSDFSRCSGIDANFRSMEEAKRAYAIFDNIVCVSKQAETEFVRLMGYGEKTVTIYNPIPVETVREKSLLPCPHEKKRFTVTTVGHLYKVKGFDRLIRSCAALEKEGFELELVIVGFGGERENLELLAKSCGAGNVVFEGKQENPYPYVRQADLYVCSSHYEGYNLAVAEALILGTPVLSTDCAGPRELLGDGEYGMLVENSEEALLAGMRRVMSEPGLLETMREKARERAQFFACEPIIEQIEGLMNR